MSTVSFCTKVEPRRRRSESNGSKRSKRSPRRQEWLGRLAAALAPIHPRLRGAPADLPFVLDVSSLRNGLNFTKTRCVFLLFLKFPNRLQKMHTETRRIDLHTRGSRSSRHGIAVLTRGHGVAMGPALRRPLQAVHGPADALASLTRRVRTLVAELRVGRDQGSARPRLALARLSRQDFDGRGDTWRRPAVTRHPRDKAITRPAVTTASVTCEEGDLHEKGSRSFQVSTAIKTHADRYRIV